MKKISLLWVLALAVAVAVPAVAGDHEKCTADTQTCLNMMVSKLKARGWVGIEMDEEDGKLTILRVEDESPAAEAGLREGDVLVAVNDQPVNTLKEYADVLRKLEPGDAVKIRFLRGSELRSAETRVVER